MTAALLVATLPFPVARTCAGHTEGSGWQCGGSGMQSWYTLIFACISSRKAATGVGWAAWGEACCCCCCSGALTGIRQGCGVTEKRGEEAKVGGVPSPAAATSL